MVTVKGNKATFVETVTANFGKTLTLAPERADVKALCAKMSLNGMGFRGIERVTGISHNSVINWVRQAASAIPDENYEIPQTAQIDELQTFVGSKKTSSGCGQQ